MKEKLLQFIWQFQYFNLNSLTTLSGDALQIIDPGKLNLNQGPDFLLAKIKINNTLWIGNIEIHIKSGSWYSHQHDIDNNFKNVILHVVWENDIDVYDQNGAIIPTLCIQDRVSKIMLNKYESLMNSKGFLPCAGQLENVNKITLATWQDRLVIERLQRKASKVFKFQAQNNQNWEESLWWLISRNFGTKVNSQFFEDIARSIPISILGKHRNQLHQIEALLLGQAGLLEKSFQEDYPIMLQKEFRFLKHKYKLEEVPGRILLLRMRPANFPTIRLAQLAVMVSQSEHIFSKILETTNFADLKKHFEITANEYWHYHYLPDVISEYKPKSLGVQMIENLFVNTIIPALYAYGYFNKDQGLIEKAISWLFECEAENNSITKEFKKLSLPNKNSYDSQFLIQLKTEYCNSKRCLECAIGNAIIKQQ